MFFFLAAIDSKPPKSMVLGQKCRDRARKEMAQMAYTQNVLDQVSSENFRNTTRGRSNQSARSHGTIQSQVKICLLHSKSINLVLSLANNISGAFTKC